MPNVAFGNVDPAAALNDLAGEYGVGLVLDCCMGGFLLPFVEEIGLDLEEPIVDFRLSNVTAITADPHKYGLSPKGCSVLMFGREEIQKALYYGQTDWCGYFYGSNGFAGSKSSSMTAASWACMMYIGKAGYVEQAKKITDATISFAADMEKVDNITVVGTPKLGNVCIHSDNAKFDIYSLGNYLYEMKWKMTATPKYPGLRLTIHSANVEHLDALKNFIREGVKQVMANPAKYKTGPTQKFELFNSIPEEFKREAFEENWHEYYKISNYMGDKK